MSTPQNDQDSTHHQQSDSRVLPEGYAWASDVIRKNKPLESTFEVRNNKFYFVIEDEHWKWLEGSNGQGLSYSKLSDRRIYDRNMETAWVAEEMKQNQQEQQDGEEDPVMQESTPTSNTESQSSTS